MADNQLGQRHLASAEVPAEAESGDLAGGNVGAAEVFGSVHIEAAGADVGGGIAGGEASLEPLAGGDFGAFDGGGHFCEITGTGAHEADSGMSFDTVQINSCLKCS